MKCIWLLCCSANPIGIMLGSILSSVIVPCPDASDQIPLMVWLQIIVLLTYYHTWYVALLSQRSALAQLPPWQSAVAVCCLLPGHDWYTLFLMFLTYKVVLGWADVVSIHRMPHIHTVMTGLTQRGLSLRHLWLHRFSRI